jgi:hypothetical protein
MATLLAHPNPVTSSAIHFMVDFSFKGYGTNTPCNSWPVGF